MKNIGDMIYRVVTGQIESKERCPDCFGKLKLTVILGDGSQVVIDCQTCARGFEPPTGFITRYDYDAKVEHVRIDGMDVRPDRVEYKVDMRGGDGAWSWSTVDEDKAFDTFAEAEVFAESERKRQATYQIESKEQRNKSWAWHVTYHRDNIRRHERDLERSRQQLGYAESKAKK